MIYDQKGQKQQRTHSCTELSKTQFFPLSIVKVVIMIYNYDLQIPVSTLGYVNHYLVHVIP